MTAWQIINTVIVYAWLFLVLFFLWRHAIGGSAQMHRLHMLLSENARKSADAALKAAEAAERAVRLLEDRLRHD